MGWGDYQDEKHLFSVCLRAKAGPLRDETKIKIGSAENYWLPMPVFEKIAKQSPDWTFWPDGTTYTRTTGHDERGSFAFFIDMPSGSLTNEDWKVLESKIVRKILEAYGVFTPPPAVTRDTGSEPGEL